METHGLPEAATAGLSPDDAVSLPDVAPDRLPQSVSNVSLAATAPPSVQSMGAVGALAPDVRVLGYVRPTSGYPLSVAEQANLIRRYAEDSGLRLHRLFSDMSIHRPTAREALLRAARVAPSVVLVTSVSRFGQTLTGVIKMLQALRACAAQVVLAGPQRSDGLALAALMDGLDALNTLRDDLHRDAAARGRDRARAQGVSMGRPRVPADRIERARLALQEGASIRAAARRAGISAASVLRHTREPSGQFSALRDPR